MKGCKSEKYALLEELIGLLRYNGEILRTMLVNRALSLITEMMSECIEEKKLLDALLYELDNLRSKVLFMNHLN